MKPLPTTLKLNGSTLTQIKRCGMIAIYEAKRRNVKRPTWEVIKIRTKKARTVFGKQVPNSEVYPSSEQFGQYAKCCASLNRANEVFELWRNDPKPARLAT